MPRLANSLLPPPLNQHPKVGKQPLRGALVILLALSTLGAGCATTGPTPEHLKAQAAYPLQATSLQPAPYAPLPVPPPCADGPGVTKPWMEEQLRKFDDRYAQSAADIKAVFEQSVATMNSVVTPTDLKPLTAGIGKVGADLTALSGRFESLASSLQSRIKDLERMLAELKVATPPASALVPPSAPGPDAESREFNEALKALQAAPRQTLPLRAWLDAHPQHPKAPEALFQLGLAFLDAGYPSAGKLYLKRLVGEYAASLQAAEAKALLGPKPAAKPAKHAAPNPAASPARLKPDTPDCDPKVLCAPTTGATNLAPKPESLAGPTSAPLKDAKDKGTVAPLSDPASPGKEGKDKADPSSPAAKSKQTEKSAGPTIPMPGSAQSGSVTPAGLVPHPRPPAEPIDAPPALIPAAKRLK